MTNPESGAGAPQAVAVTVVNAEDAAAIAQTQGSRLIMQGQEALTDAAQIQHGAEVLAIAAAAGAAPVETQTEAVEAKPDPLRFVTCPTVSRFVWYKKHRDDGIPGTEDKPLSAHICGVIDDETVNLAVFGYDGSGPYARQKVRLVQHGEPRPGQCVWMPYQRGQAEKAAQLEAELAKKG